MAGSKSPLLMDIVDESDTHRLYRRSHSGDIHLPFSTRLRSLEQRRRPLARDTRRLLCMYHRLFRCLVNVDALAQLLASIFDVDITAFTYGEFGDVSVGYHGASSVH